MKSLKTVLISTMTVFSISLSTLANSAGQEKYQTTCVGCHGENGQGVIGPKLAGQKPEEIVSKLKMYKAGEQMGPMTSMMAPMAMSLSETDMENIAEYVSGL